MDAIGITLAVIGGVLSFLTCRPSLSPEGIAGATACSVLQAAATAREPDSIPAEATMGPPAPGESVE